MFLGQKLNLMIVTPHFTSSCLQHQYIWKNRLIFKPVVIALTESVVIKLMEWGNTTKLYGKSKYILLWLQHFLQVFLQMYWVM